MRCPGVCLVFGHIGLGRRQPNSVGDLVASLHGRAPERCARSLAGPELPAAGRPVPGSFASEAPPVVALLALCYVHWQEVLVDRSPGFRLATRC